MGFKKGEINRILLGARGSTPDGSTLSVSELFGYISLHKIPNHEHSPMICGHDGFVDSNCFFWALFGAGLGI
jgi:hypothetical protein